MSIWPQLVYLGLMVFGLGLALSKHGDQTTISIWAISIRSGVALALLYFGGFFDPLLR